MLHIVSSCKQQWAGLRSSYAIVLALALIGLVACVPVPQPEPPGTATPVVPTPTKLLSPTTPPLQDWQTRWLKGIPCRPPCWEGITPGQTTAEEAVEILRRSTIIATVEVTTLPLRPETGVVKWKWASTGKEGGGATFHSQTPPSPIYAIYPSYPYTSFKLSDVIQVYGEPGYIMANSYYPPGSSDIYYDLRILYLSQGFMLDGDGGRVKPTLSADTRLERVSFFVPGEEGLLAALDGWTAFPNLFVPWQGMKDFDYYCRDEAGKPCP